MARTVVRATILCPWKNVPLLIPYLPPVVKIFLKLLILGLILKRLRKKIEKNLDNICDSQRQSIVWRIVLFHNSAYA